jgi:hypothetical protein
MNKNETQLIQKQLQGLRRKFHILAWINVVIIVSIVIGVILVRNKVFDNSKTTQTPTLTKIETKTPIINEFQTNITSFYNNSAISEVGYQLELKKQNISTHKTTNCFTTEVPPLQNGCGFVVRPYATSIPAEDSFLRNIVFNATMGGEDKIVVDIRNSEKNEITKTVGIIQGNSSDLSLQLPSKLGADEQILVRLWPQKDSEITINEVAFEHLNSTKLQPVNLKLDEELSQKLSGKTFEIYIDNNKDGTLDKDIDQLWNCVDGFPGVKAGIISGNQITLQRNDICKTPISAYRNDKGVNALPSFYWLLVVDSQLSDPQVFPFKVQKGVTDYDLQ